MDTSSQWKVKAVHDHPQIPQRLLTNNTLHSEQLLHTSGPPAVVTAVTLPCHCWTWINSFWLCFEHSCASASQTRISVLLQQLLQPLHPSQFSPVLVPLGVRAFEWISNRSLQLPGHNRDVSRALYLKSSLNSSDRVGWGGYLQASSHISMQTGLFILCKHRQIQQKFAFLTRGSNLVLQQLSDTVAPSATLT